MKLIMVLGGVLGFSIGFGFSWAQGSPWPSTVWRAATTALLAGVLLRWWGQLWIRCLRSADVERKTAALKKAEPASNQPPAKK
jgi:protein-S-isoprenylcysteine O-methyltransferase Ste14